MPEEKPKPKSHTIPAATDKEITEFADWTGSGGITDNRKAAEDLKRRGLQNAQQLIDDTPDIKSGSSIKNAQSSWKVAAIQHMLANAKRLGIKKDEEFDANIPALTSSLAPQYQDALKNPSFAALHPNFLPVVKSILKDQYKKEDAKRNQLALNSAKTVDEFFKK